MISRFWSMPCINGIPNMSYEAFLDIRFKQNVTDARRCSFDRNISVTMSGYENDGLLDVAASQKAHQFHAGHSGHAIIDNKAIGGTACRSLEQCLAAAECPHLKTVDFEQESQRAKHIGIVVDDVNDRDSG